MVRLPKLPELPDLPDPERVFSIIDKANSAFDKGLGIIDMVAGRLDRVADKIGPPTEKSPAKQTAPAKGKGVTDQQTLAYQLDHIIAPLRQLELHLAEKGKIMGVPCDCIAKAALDVSIFAEETIPIAARQRQEAKFYTELASWAKRMQTIGNEEAVSSGKHDDKYLAESGNASRFRKQVQAMLAELGSQPEGECPTCEKVKTLKEHLVERKKEREVL